MGYVTQAIILIARFLAKAGRIPLKGVMGLYYFLKRRWVWLIVILVFFIIPELLGSYTFLTSNGLPWYHAAYSSVSVQFGGAAFTAYNTLIALIQQGINPDSIPLLIGLSSTFFSLMYYIIIWMKANRFFARTAPSFWILALGAMIISLMIMNTLLIDDYVLEDEELRVSGMTYFIENPKQSLEPIAGSYADYSGNYTNSSITWNNTVDEPVNETETDSGGLFERIRQINQVMAFLGGGN